ncbi:MAG: alpha/beta hydrolase family protein [Candidatus Hodarchaeota archaeon]
MMREIIIENIDIPVNSGNIALKGSIYYTLDTPSKAPFIVILGGLWDHRETPFVKSHSEKFAKAGYYVLSYDYRAHGETKKQTGSLWYKMILQIFADIHLVFDWIIENQSDRLLEEQIFLFGRSMGGAIILTNGYIDHRAKKLIALCTRYDYHTTAVNFQEDIIKKISPKYFLREDPLNQRILIAHCKDDDRIPFDNFHQIKEKLGLNDENAIEFDSGGHSFKGHREEIFKYSLEFLKKLE